MSRKTGQYYLNIAGIVFVSATFLEAVGAQAIGQTDILATNSSPFSSPSMTLSGTVTVAPPMPPPQTQTQTVTFAELTQRVRVALDSKNYRAALEYATLGLTASPKDVRLLKAKAYALMNLNRLPDAIATYKDALALEPNDSGTVNDLAELLLITGQISEYRTFESQHKQQLDTAYDGVLSKYFAVLEAYQTGNDDQLRDIATRLLTALPSQKGPLLGDWEFNVLLSVISQRPDSPKKAMLMTFVRVLTGELNRDDALKKVRTP